MSLITHAPLPKWACFLLFIFTRTRHLTLSWVRDEEIAGWFSRSAWSFVRIALWRAEKTSMIPVIWVPDFFCNSTLFLLRAMGVKLVFYPITAKLQPDYAVCRQMAKKLPPDVFILVHYLGASTPAAPARDFCGQYGAWLVEDAAHVLKPTLDIGVYGDFIVYSPHKLLPLPDGALLVVRPNGASQFGKEGILSFGDQSSWVASLKNVEGLDLIQQQGHTKTVIVWLMKRLLQKLGIRFKEKYINYVETGQESIVVKLPVPAMSWFSQRLLATMRTHLTDIMRWRQRNLLLWDELLLDHEAYSGLLQASERSFGQDGTPYLAGYEMTSYEDAQAIFYQLKEQGLPVIIWPDLPLEVFRNQELHNTAWNLRHKRIYLPVHQSIRPHHICACLEIKKNTKIHLSTSNVELVWDCTEDWQWHEWLVSVGQSNLLQSYEYGEAKAKAEGWRVRRGVFRLEGDPVAIVQVLEKRLSRLIVFSRVNRGPLYLHKLNAALQRNVMQCLLSELSCPSRGRWLYFTPDLLLSGESIHLLSSMRIRQFNPHGWSSIYLNICLDELELRKKLHGKWRNMLVFAEKQNIMISIDNDQLSFEWLLAQCNTMMIERKQAALPVKLYRQLRHELEKSKKPILVLRAVIDDCVIAGIGIVPHGVTATYLLGWNGEDGRKLKANQLLLWKAILHLKQQGFQWFDLGGINEAEVPGISAFKQGIGGEQYMLVGDGWV